MQSDPIEIIFQNDDFIVINKPAGLSTTKDRSSKINLMSVLSEQMPQAAFRLVHRLDKFTSGAMILAKNLPTQSRFSSDFEKKLVKKTYLALVSGYIPKSIGTIKAPLAHSKKDNAVMVVSSKRGKPAITHWQLLANFGTVSLLKVNPITGRTHQIRAHLKHVSMPLAIDPQYSSSAPLMLSDIKPGYRLAKGRTEKPLIDRLTLHCYQLKLTNPVENGPSEFTAGLDKKFAAAIKMFAKHNPNGPAAFSDAEIYEKILKGEPID